LSAAEQLLKGFGISEPNEIDLEAIAWTLGASVKYKRLDGCEARIIGDQHKAIITINNLSHTRRKRFSLAHELGHWHHHRGQLLFCQSVDMRIQDPKCDCAERLANLYAAELLMPYYLLDELVMPKRELGLKQLESLADQFSVSRTAMAIRIVKRYPVRSILVCHSTHGLKWYIRSPDIQDGWSPRPDLEAGSSAFNILFGGRPDMKTPIPVSADAWFNRRDASGMFVHEQTFRVSETETISLLSAKERRMLIV